MTSRRTKKSIVYKCDRLGCKAKHASAVGAGFGEACFAAKAEGWVAAKVGEKWLHFCMWVHRPSDVQIKDLVTHAH